MTSVNKLINDVLNTQKSNDKGVLWDTLKMEIRGYTISYSSHKAKIMRKQETKLLSELNKIEVKINEEPNENVKQEYTTITRELEALNNEITRGNQIRARAMHIECNGKNSAYFLNREKANHQVRNITTLHNDDVTILMHKNTLWSVESNFIRTFTLKHK